MNANKYDECPEDSSMCFTFLVPLGSPGCNCFFMGPADLMNSYDFLMCHGMLNRSKARANTTHPSHTHTHTHSHTHTPAPLPGMRCKNSQVSWPCTHRSKAETAHCSPLLGFYFGLNTGDLWFIFGRAHKIGVVIESSINIRLDCVQ